VIVERHELRRNGHWYIVRKSCSSENSARCMAKMFAIGLRHTAFGGWVACRPTWSEPIMAIDQIELIEPGWEPELL